MKPKEISEGMDRDTAAAIAALGKKSSRLIELDDDRTMLIDDEAGRWWVLYGKEEVKRLENARKGAVEK